MKVEYKKPEFTPITLIIESQAELDALWIAMNTDRNSFHSHARAMSNLEAESVVSAEQQVVNIWKVLNEVRNEVKKS